MIMLMATVVMFGSTHFFLAVVLVWFNLNKFSQRKSALVKTVNWLTRSIPESTRVNGRSNAVNTRPGML
ncbi:hypothetical protein Hdeb2414_s0009g00320151 [Helianthus debilis subsp. tardiflorus]